MKERVHCPYNCGTYNSIVSCCSKGNEIQTI